MSREQIGFRSGSFCTDHHKILRIIVQLQRGIPVKLIAFIGATYVNTKPLEISGEFEMQNGLRLYFATHFFLFGMGDVKRYSGWCHVKAGDEERDAFHGASS